MKLIEKQQPSQLQLQHLAGSFPSYFPRPLDTIRGDGMCTGRFQHLRIRNDPRGQIDMLLSFVRQIWTSLYV